MNFLRIILSRSSVRQKNEQEILSFKRGKKKKKKDRKGIAHTVPILLFTYRVLKDWLHSPKLSATSPLLVRREWGRLCAAWIVRRGAARDPDRSVLSASTTERKIRLSVG